METFADIYVLDLHGNSKKKERCPDGSEDENVFDIRQGVAIGIFVKCKRAKKKPTTVYHSDLWGVREIYEKNAHGEQVLSGGKYHWLWQNELSTTQWKKHRPQPPFYLFVPQNIDLKSEYEKGCKVTDFMTINSTGAKTHRDQFVLDFDLPALRKRIADFRNLHISNEKITALYNLHDTRDWKLDQKRHSLARNAYWDKHFTQNLYRPFDLRFYYHHEDVVELPRNEVMQHLLAGDNISILFVRQMQDQVPYSHVFASKRPIVDRTFLCSRGAASISPLYLYPTIGNDNLFATEELTPKPNRRRANLNAEFVTNFATTLNLAFILNGKGNLEQTFGPEDVFDYMYAVFHSPTYRSRYAEFLRIDYPRLPLTSNTHLFRVLCALGSELVGLHLMERHAPMITNYPISGDNRVETIHYTEPVQGADRGRVWINREQYFEGVPPEVWAFHIGGYQVCQKWLKDRKARQLTYNDLTYYQGIVSAIAETIHIMAEIDASIDEHGGWPIV